MSKPGRPQLQRNRALKPEGAGASDAFREQSQP